jgi:hypothetical protein
MCSRVWRLAETLTKGDKDRVVSDGDGAVIEDDCWDAQLPTYPLEFDPLIHVNGHLVGDKIETKFGQSLANAMRVRAPLSLV